MDGTDLGSIEGPVRVLIVEDHPVYRSGLELLLRSIPWVEPVGEAGSGGAALSIASARAVDVALMDLGLPDMSGIEATRRLLALRPATRVICLTMLEDDDSIFAAMRAGARGYLLKGADQAEIVNAIRSVAMGDVIFGRGVAQRVMAFFAGRDVHRAETVFPDLSERERQVLELLAMGRDTADIARQLGLASKTVQNNVSSILNKLRVTDRSQAVARARDAGLGSGG